MYKFDIFCIQEWNTLHSLENQDCDEIIDEMRNQFVHYNIHAPNSKTMILYRKNLRKIKLNINNNNSNINQEGLDILLGWDLPLKTTLL